MLGCYPLPRRRERERKITTRQRILLDKIQSRCSFRFFPHFFYISLDLVFSNFFPCIWFSSSSAFLGLGAEVELQLNPLSKLSIFFFGREEVFWGNWSKKLLLIRDCFVYNCLIKGSFCCLSWIEFRLISIGGGVIYPQWS